MNDINLFDMYYIIWVALLATIIICALRLQRAWGLFTNILSYLIDVRIFPALLYTSTWVYKIRNSYNDGIQSFDWIVKLASRAAPISGQMVKAMKLSSCMAHKTARLGVTGMEEYSEFGLE